MSTFLELSLSNMALAPLAKETPLISAAYLEVNTGSCYMINQIKVLLTESVQLP